jgi:tetratricopeptide (TPR) repeat protein
MKDMNRKYMTAVVLFTLGAVTALMMPGCSSDKPTPPPPPFDVEGSLVRAWGYFSSDNYDDGAELFSEVIKNSESNSEAYLGRGWCYAFIGEKDSAFNDLWIAITYDTHNRYTIDANMGLAAVVRDCPGYVNYLTQAIDRANAVIDADSTYVFSRKPSIDYKDAHLIIAQSYFRRGVAYFSYAHTTVNYLCDLQGLDPLPDAASVPADEYERLLAEKIEILTEQIGD